MLRIVGDEHGRKRREQQKADDARLGQGDIGVDKVFPGRGRGRRQRLCTLSVRRWRLQGKGVQRG